MEVGLTRTISLIFIVLFSSFLVAALLNAKVMNIQFDRTYDAWVPLFLVVVSVGVYRRTRWGRWFMYPVALFMCLGIPLGTLLGGFMFWHLTKYRAAFTTWY